MAERVMVVPRNILFKEGRDFNGFSPAGTFDFTARILENHSFLLRKTTDHKQELPVEEDPGFKQIIPYCLFAHNGKLFLYERLNQGGEKRLHNQYSIGVGGHINPIDAGDDVLEKAMLREFREELHYNGKLSWELIGFINLDNKEPVHKVHFGLVYLFKGDSSAISVREMDTLSGKLTPLEGVMSSRDRMERWSRACVDYLRDNPHIMR